MGDASTALRILDPLPALAPERDLASDLFHRINRIIPDNQKVLTVRPETTVREAVRLMREHGYSQLPVVQDGHVVGVFSYRSLAIGTASKGLEDWKRDRCAPGDLTVDEFTEEFEFVRMKGEMRKALDYVERDGAVLVGTPENLLNILTATDFVEYLNEVAGPFVLVSEIERALRTIIRLALTPEEIAESARVCLAGLYTRKDQIPIEIEDMTFDNYKVLVSRGETWRVFQPLLGSTAPRVRAKLESVGVIRNVLFHFKREITLEDHESLTEHRSWLLSKVQQAELRRRNGDAR